MKVGRGDRDRVPLKLRMLEKINWSGREMGQGTCPYVPLNIADSFIIKSFWAGKSA